jgi:hypothetical protein
MTPRNPGELKNAIERYEVLYLNLEDYSAKKQVLQTLLYLRETLKSKKRTKRSRP